MHGLPWSNQSYDHRTRNLSNLAPLSAVSTSQNAELSGATWVSTNLACFRKPTQRFCDSTIDMRNVTATEKEATPIGHFVALFDIFPVSDSKTVK